MRLLQHAVAFVENQCGKHDAETSSYSTENGVRIEAWNVEMGMLCKLYTYLGTSDTDSPNAIFYYKKIIEILGPWILQITPIERSRIDVLTEEQIEVILNTALRIEVNLSLCYLSLHDLDQAQYYQEQSVLHAKQLKEGENKIKKLYDTMKCKN
jgi:hypothetical protein